MSLLIYDDHESFNVCNDWSIVNWDIQRITSTNEMGICFS